MSASPIKNVVFDIGNVIVRWSPIEIVRLTFSDREDSEQLAKSIFQGDLWMQLNRGEISEPEAKISFQRTFGFSVESTDQLFYYVKQTQLLLFGSIKLLKKVKAAGYEVYALTDNVHEIVDHLQSHYNFWSLFDGAIVSAEVGCLKPDKVIFNHLLTRYKLQASESVFIDDMPYNVQGAISLGFTAIQFENSSQCERELKQLGLVF